MIAHVKIYQIDSDKDKDRSKFMGIDSGMSCVKRTEDDNLVVPKGLYLNVYSNDFVFNDRDSMHHMLDRLFQILNADDRPAGDKMHSLSVSDIIEVKKNVSERETSELFFCDLIGWPPVRWEEDTHEGQK